MLTPKSPVLPTYYTYCFFSSYLVCAGNRFKLNIFQPFQHHIFLSLCGRGGKYSCNGCGELVISVPIPRNNTLVSLCIRKLNFSCRGTRNTILISHSLPPSISFQFCLKWQLKFECLIYAMYHTRASQDSLFILILTLSSFRQPVDEIYGC